MRIIRAIVIASFSVPVLVFILVLGVSLGFLGTEFFGDGEHSSGWPGIVYAGAMYAYIAILISTIPTIVLGLPMCLVAQKYGFLTNKVVLIGAVIAGGLYLGIAAALFFETVSVQLFLWIMFAGGVGGVLNGYVFLRFSKPGV